MNNFSPDWKTWCRLCGNYETNGRIDPEIEQTVKQVFEVHAKNAFVCLDCNSYVRDFLRFLGKTRVITGMFEDLERLTLEGKIDHLQVALQLRKVCNLSVPDIEIVEPPEEESNDNFTLEDDAGEEYEYLIEADEAEQNIIEIDIVKSEFEMLENSGDEDEVECVTEEQEIDEFFNAESVDYTFEDDEIEEEFTDSLQFGEEVESDDVSQYFVFRCHVCNEEFPKMCYLSIHTRTVHDSMPKVDCGCGRTIATSRALMTHYESHYKKSKFRCDECKKNFKTQTNYQNHMTSYHRISLSGRIEEKNFQCSQCGKSFKQARHLAVHNNSHLPNDLKFTHECNLCEKRYSSVFSLRQHIKHVHVKEPTYKCTHCNKLFSRKANLDSHISHVHTSALNFKCDICHLAVKTKGILRVHRKLHTTNPEDMLSCNVCERKFKTQNQLTNHMICHSNIKKHKCLHCPAEYKRSKELTCHVASAHTGEARYTCQFCPKSFFNNSNYRKHRLKMHSKETSDTDQMYD